MLAMQIALELARPAVEKQSSENLYTPSDNGKQAS
jgi:hypothetical protein